MLFERHVDIDIVQVFSGGTHTSDGGMMEERAPVGNILFPEPPLHGTPDSVKKEKSRFDHIRKGSVIIPHSASGVRVKELILWSLMSAHGLRKSQMTYVKLCT